MWRTYNEWLEALQIAKFIHSFHFFFFPIEWMVRGFAKNQVHINHDFSFFFFPGAFCWALKVDLHALKTIRTWGSSFGILLSIFLADFLSPEAKRAWYILQAIGETYDQELQRKMKVNTHKNKKTETSISHLKKLNTL